MVWYCGRLITKDSVRCEEYGSAADNAGAAERRRLGSVCRGSKLDAKRLPQLLKACRCYVHLWEPEEQAAFNDLQAAIMDSMTLAFPDPDKRICVLTDASDRFYEGLVTQMTRSSWTFR
jgi:RNase H-like domain found in reverse transcriptase